MGYKRFENLGSLSNLPSQSPWALPLSSYDQFFFFQGKLVTKLGPLLTQSVRNLQSVSFGTNFPCISI